MAFRVSERNSLRLDATKDHITYSGGNLPFRTGYNDTRASLGIDRNVDERNVVSAIMSAERYEADVNQNKTDTVTIEGAFTRPVTELWTLSLAAGVLRSDYTVLDNNQQLTNRATTDYTMRLGFRKRAERSRINLDFTRDIYPSTSGYSSLRREVLLYYDRDLRQRLRASFGIRVNKTEALGNVNVADNRDYDRMEIGFEWAISPVMFLDAGYSYTAQDFTEDIFRNKSDSNALYIGVAYRGKSKR
jgi:opacity protein-like surface antigen